MAPGLSYTGREHESSARIINRTNTEKTNLGTAVI